MARVTSKRQVTIPKSIADQYGIAIGDEIEFIAAGDAIRVERPGAGAPTLDRTERLARFDQATKRQQARQADTDRPSPDDRDWRRSDLYERASAR
jgi:AbrB family looped-hinge helix DNA binding protein